MAQIMVDVCLSSEELLRLYRGTARLIRAVDTVGHSVQFPANILSSYINHDGINPRFVISYSASGTFTGVEKIA